VALNQRRARDSRIARILGRRRLRGRNGPAIRLVAPAFCNASIRTWRSFASWLTRERGSTPPISTAQPLCMSLLTLTLIPSCKDKVRCLKWRFAQRACFCPWVQIRLCEMGIGEGQRGSGQQPTVLRCWPSPTGRLLDRDGDHSGPVARAGENLRASVHAPSNQEGPGACLHRHAPGRPSGRLGCASRRAASAPTMSVARLACVKSRSATLPWRLAARQPAGVSHQVAC
jgi:hypothetical protein